MKRSIDSSISVIWKKKTGSTNADLKKMILKNEQPAHLTTIWAEEQTKGKGMGSNTWEAQKGKNLTFSTLVQPKSLPAKESFYISMAVSVAIVRVLQPFHRAVKIKWPNDIYIQDFKVAGILIENFMEGKMLQNAIVGVGLNINQKKFTGGAPNPISMIHITLKPLNRKEIFASIIAQLKETLTLLEDPADQIELLKEYHQSLYRKERFSFYKDKEGIFKGQIKQVFSDGLLEIEKESGKSEYYRFKEVEFLIPHDITY